jgi:signal transduction histidine kinase/PAS domain-containing protein
MTATARGQDGEGGAAGQPEGHEIEGRAAAVRLFAGPGEVRALARTLDWGATPLGWPDTWSPALRIATRAMLDAPHPICLWSGPEYALVYNDAYRRILAAKHPAALGQPGSVVWAEIWAGLAPQFAQVSAGGPAVYGEDARFVMARLEGGGTEDAWFSYSLSPLRDEDGTIVAVLNISPETTARVRAEQALESERERLAAIVRIAPAFMAVLRGPDHVIELTNAGYDALAGHRALRGRPVAEALPEAAAQGFVALLDRVLTTGEPFAGREVPYRRPDAAGVEDLRYVDFVYQALAEADGTRSGVFVHGVDVTDQVRARGEVERLLAESERARAEADTASARLAFLAEASERLAASLDYETTLREILALAVPMVADWALYTVDAGDGTLRIVASRHAEPAKEAFITETASRYPIRADEPAGAAKVLRTGEPELIPEVPDAVLAAVARDPTHLELLRAVGFRSLMTVPVSVQGRTLGALGFVTGASGRRYGPEDLALARELARRAATALDQARLYAEAERRRTEAESANAAKSQFLSTMSHELRTPLNAIGGYTELLSLGVRGPITDAQRQDLERVRLANQHLMALVTDILNFTRVDAGHVEYRPADVELASVMGGLESLIGPQLAAKGIAFDHDACASDTPDRPHVVRADPEKLRQILLNLLSNAVKFTESGGRVAIVCETDREANVIRVRVRDTGRGIPPDQLERIFEPFVQLDRHRTHESQQGIGLGLAISRELARGMGGDLTVASRPGAGSTFTLTLPA